MAIENLVDALQGACLSKNGKRFKQPEADRLAGHRNPHRVNQLAEFLIPFLHE